MEEKKLPIPKDFFKQFKNKEEFHTFFNSLFKEGVEEMLKGELDELEIPKSWINLFRFELTSTVIEYQYLGMNTPSGIDWSHCTEFPQSIAIKERAR